MLCGVFINGPYAVITTAVSNDLVRTINTGHFTVHGHGASLSVIACIYSHTYNELLPLYVPTFPHVCREHTNLSKTIPKQKQLLEELLMEWVL